MFFFASPGWSADSALTSSSEPQQMMDFNIAGYGAKGEKTWEVAGASMDIVGNEVKISDITAKLYGDRENMVLTADKGQFDKDRGVVHLTQNVRAVTDSGAHLNTDTLNWSQKEQKITTEDEVHINRQNMKATATGIEARPDLKEAKFTKDVVLTIEEQKKIGRQKGQMVITCDGPMELNYDRQVAVFEKNVKVEGDRDQGTMTADKMTVYFNPSDKQIDRIEAVGHVRITRDENTSFSDGAIFTNADKKLVLTGRPKLIIFTEAQTDVSP